MREKSTSPTFFKTSKRGHNGVAAYVDALYAYLSLFLPLNQFLYYPLKTVRITRERD